MWGAVRMPMRREYTHDQLHQRSGSVSVKSSGDSDGGRGRDEPGTLITNNNPWMKVIKNNYCRTANKLTLSLLHTVIFLLALVVAGHVIADVTVTQQPQDAKAAVEWLPANLANTPTSFTPLQVQFNAATPTRRTPITTGTDRRMAMINVGGTDPTSTTPLCAIPCGLNSKSGIVLAICCSFNSKF